MTGPRQGVTEPLAVAYFEVLALCRRRLSKQPSRDTTG